MTVKFVTTVQLVDERQASTWLDKRYEHQRNISHAHVANLARAMWEGKFSPVGSVKISFSGGDGEPHLLDSQHTLLAILKSKRPQLLPIIYYTCDTPEEEAELYYRTDNVRKRTLADGFRALDVPRHLGLTRTQLNYVAAALRFAKANFGASSARRNFVSSDDILEWIPNWTLPTKMIYHAISPCQAWERNLILRKAVLSVALVTTFFKAREAKNFWGDVVRADGLDRDNPAKTLREWLLLAQKQGTAPGDKLRNDKIARGAIYAWNAAQDGRSLKSIVVHDKSSVVRIVGTDYSGHQDPSYIPLYERADVEPLTLDGLAEQASQWETEMREEQALTA